uniref:Uncharacterized protein n=1 Tax=Megaselia scalaris TaxID=36166 RepID=T1GU82_MEGSC
MRKSKSMSLNAGSKLKSSLRKFYVRIVNSSLQSNYQLKLKVTEFKQ